MKIMNVFVLSILMLCANIAFAEPRTAVSSINQVRAYSNGDYFVTLSSNQLADGGTCTTTYRVRGNLDGAGAVTATILTALALGQMVQIEVPTSTGCTGFGSEIQSIFLAP